MAAALAFVGAFGAMPAWSAAQQPEESVTLSRSTALIGERLTLVITVVTPEGSTVELTPGTDSWQGVEVVGIKPPQPTAQGDQLSWRIEAEVTSFELGETTFAPSVAIISGTDVRARTLSPVSVTIASVLPPDAELVLRPLAPPVAIEGSESPLLRPAIAAGGVLLVFLVLGIMWFLWRRLRRALGGRHTGPLAIPQPEEELALDAAERVLDSDPVAAYRVMSTVVKSELAKRHGLRATALTTNELRSRLEHAGVDRWEARLVGGLLEECDAVIYAGYRPAAERRAADLTMAREIVEVA